MEMMLADNIRRFRKERSLTQEQLAEVLGVTAGAVYKWEAGLSVPDLELIVEMADFYDISVDVLLGYTIKDNRLESTLQRLKEFRRRKDREGLAEAEKALKKYPHSFKIVHESATMYLVFGVESRDKADFRRALELMEQARLLIAQNTDPQISEQSLYADMAEAYLGLDEEDKALELLKAHNAGRVHSYYIGYILSQTGHPEEAVPFLSEGMTKILSNLFETIIGYMNVYYKGGDYASCEAILEWGSALMLGLRKDGKPNFFDKINCAMFTALAAARLAQGKEDDARDSLIRAKETAVFFDASPSYDESDIRFITRIEGSSIHDGIGVTAMDVVSNTVAEFENEKLAALWNSAAGQKESHNHE